MTKDERLRWFEATLEQAGMRRTLPRRVLLRLIAASERPLSAQDIYEQTAEEINLVTIYRTLNELTRLELLIRTEFGEGFYRYEPAPGPSDTEHHHHVVCDNCGTIADFEGCMVDAMLEQTHLPDNFQVDSHTLTLHGTCGRCLAQTATK
ncbi:Fur family transcriptional regulator [Armatimonas sp.]|uniref:Fur family transcriptional regulator n=1 Tax=Armatimonas sp. TaxID=1872638 RepID=UPI00286CE5E0|nr:Fur family transcriptional regulator [Armatimonas sp.]